MNLQEITITSKRLLLTPISDIYADYIFKEFDYNLTKYMCPAPAKEIDETFKFINDTKKKLADGISLQCVVLLSESKEFLGCAGIYQLNTKNPELGLWIKKSHHKKGFGKELIFSLMNWAKENYEIDYFIYPVDKRNIASRKIPEAYNATVKRSYKQTSMSNRQLDIIEYHIPN